MNLKVDLVCGTVLDTTFSGFEDFIYRLVFPYPECTEPDTETDIILSIQDNGFYGQDACTNTDFVGITVPSLNKRINPLQHTVCFDPNIMQWRFNVENIVANILSELCDNNIANNYRPIDDISEIDSTDICDALEDIQNHRPYPPALNNNDYLLKWVIKAHEDQHVKVYRKLLEKYKPKINSLIDSYRISCTDALTSDKLEAKWISLKDGIEEFFKKILKRWNNLLNDPEHEKALQAQPEVQIPITLAWGDLRRLNHSFVYCYD